MLILILGLYGSDGLLPACAELNLKDQRPFIIKFWEKPTLLHFAPLFGLNVQYGAELLALVAILMSFTGFALFNDNDEETSAHSFSSFSHRLAFQGMCNMVNFAMLWISYLSVYEIGQTFMHFQWDILLLETGLITIIVAPLAYSKPKTATPKDRVTFWLVKWLIFRLMFASGVVKLTSKCPSWWGLTGSFYILLKISRVYY